MTRHHEPSCWCPNCSRRRWYRLAVFCLACAGLSIVGLTLAIYAVAT